MPEKGKGFQAEKWGTRDQLRDISQELKNQLDTSDKIDDIVNRTFKVKQLSLAAAKSAGDINNKTTKNQLKSKKLDAEALDMAQNLVGNVKARLAGFKKIIVAGRLFNMVAKANPYMLLVGIIIAIGVAFLKFQKAVAQTRRDLGVSAVEAAKLNVRFKVLGLSAKLYGGSAESVRESFDAIRENFGGIEQATSGFVLKLDAARNFTGATADQTARVLALQESISSASRETLLAQMKVRSAMIRTEGIASSAVFRDIAENAEFFAQFAKSGGDNLFRAGIAAKKLGLGMSQVAGITNSLLDFESSIEAQLKASMLLGRQINLDRARQLALTGDQEGMLKEILIQVGGEAEFTKMNVLQRKALAESVGVNVEELSRLVRNQSSGAAGQGELNRAMTTELDVLNAIHEKTKATSEATAASAESSAGMWSFWKAKDPGG